MEIGGVEVVAFPGPGTLLDLDELGGVSATKVKRIRALAAAASAGDLSPELLRSLELDEALTHLESLPGIGPFGAMLILARGAGHPDVPPPTLHRFRQAVAAAYGLSEEPDEAKLAELVGDMAAVSRVGDVAAAQRHERLSRVRLRGLEPPRPEGHGHLKPGRLPIPPQPRDWNETADYRVSVSLYDRRAPGVVRRHLGG